MKKQKTVLRLDKYLGDLGFGTRKEIKEYIKDGRVVVGGEIITRPEHKVSTETSQVLFDDELLEYRNFVYVLMNKPAGVVSATSDPYGEIPVTDLLPEEYAYYGLAPVGRLDKDAVGLLLLTNDGKYNHQMTSPKKHIFKTYYALVQGSYSEDDRTKVQQGIIIDKGYKCKPAELYPLEEYAVQSAKHYLPAQCREYMPEELSQKIGTSGYYEAVIRISEGKFHQVKRMFEALGQKVIYLKRIGFGRFDLPEGLAEGQIIEIDPSNE